MRPVLVVLPTLCFSKGLTRANLKRPHRMCNTNWAPQYRHLNLISYTNNQDIFGKNCLLFNKKERQGFLQPQIFKINPSPSLLFVFVRFKPNKNEHIANFLPSVKSRCFVRPAGLFTQWSLARPRSKFNPEHKKIFFSSLFTNYRISLRLRTSLLDSKAIASIFAWYRYPTLPFVIQFNKRSYSWVWVFLYF